MALQDSQPLSDARCLTAILRIRAISWRWRLGEAVRVPRLLLGLGRRHYGVAAQDVDRELGALIPGIVLCTAGALCPRHGRRRTAAKCTGHLMVNYRLLADVAAQATRALDGDRTSIPVPTDGTRSRRLSRRCHNLIAAIQLNAARRHGDASPRPS